MIPPPDTATELASLLEHYMAGLQAGNAPDPKQLIADNPQLAAQLEACLAGIEFIHHATSRVPERPAVLGEYRIVREIGRGGMGVVYEAEQTSLRRQVALKVLRFGVVADREAMERFRREAETVARLHHTNIVPIFAVGCEGDVHYYAMQFIEGRSLAEVLADSQRDQKPLAHEDVVAWGLQAAEALAHAHQRGVIHRDIKPSNLLLDPEGVVWLTDFGLAKRADEATLTVRGALMGTPRYMSPERAESLERAVDHRTDLYSLGASIYELATGRPVFESPTPHGVLRQILSEEPARPRLVRPGLSRDLETIILKCLSKVREQRYQSAQLLVQDLRAVLEGRPIHARRAPLRERVVRYVRKQRKALGGAAIATAATILLMIAGFAAARFYNAWRLGRLVLASDGPPLSAVVLPESGEEPIGEPFDIGTRTVLSLPHGDYRLRVTGAGLMGQTYRVAVNRGETRTHRLVLDDDHMLGKSPVPYAVVTEGIELTPGRADFIEWNGVSLIRRDGATGKALWDTSRPARPWEPNRDPAAWLRRLSAFGDEQRPGLLIQPAPDLNGDGTGDLIWAMMGTPSLLALSGKDASLLWATCVDLGTLRSPAGEGDLPIGRNLGAPIAADIDGDGIADVIAAFAVFEESRGSKALAAHPSNAGLADRLGLADRCVVIAVSGRSGQVLWDKSVGALGMPLHPAQSDRGVTLVRGKDRSFVCLGSSHCICLDLATGRPLGPALDLGFVPTRPAQYADLDADGEPEIVALGSGSHPSILSLSVFSARTGKRLWTQEARDAHYLPDRHDWARAWPLVADLDGDGRAEIVVPDYQPHRHYSGVRALDGVTGAERWVRPMRPYNGGHDGLVHLLAGPDLDGDGTNEVVAISRFDGRTLERLAGQPGEQKRVYVDALSGKDGRGLWWWRTEIGNADTTEIGVPFWSGRGPDGWPMLALPLGGNPAPGAPPQNRFYPPDPPVVHLLAAASGTEAHSIAGLSWPRASDLDGDGLADLWGSVEGTLRAFRGSAPEKWRALGQLEMAGDLDGDGLSDLVSADLDAPVTALYETKAASRTVIARSGRDGRLIWRTHLDPWDDWYNWGEWTRGYTVSKSPPGGGDLDGDGTSDILICRDAAVHGNGPPASLSLQLLSGRSGRLLWSAGLIPPLDWPTFGYCHIEGIDLCPRGQAGPADVLLLYDTPFNQGGPFPMYQQTRLTRRSHRDGRIVWDTLLAEHKGGMHQFMGFAHAFGDLDGSGKPDVVLRLRGTAAAAAAGFELRAISLEDGATLWSTPVGAPGSGQPAFILGDLDADRRSEVIVRSLPPDGIEAAVEVSAIDGRNGSTRWSWRGGEHRDPANQIGPVCLADFEGSKRRQVCLAYRISDTLARVTNLDAQGKEHAHRDLATARLPLLRSADLEGRDCELLLLQDDQQLRAVRADLKDFWSRSKCEPIRQILPASTGRAATVVLNPALGLDGATGRPIWKGGTTRALLTGQGRSTLPCAIAGPDGTTTCRTVVPISAEGTVQTARGEPARPASGREDPRWERPLPWVDPVVPHAHPLIHLAFAGALINIGLPVGIFWLATRRRFWSVRLLLALPAMVALPMAGLSALGSLLPNRTTASPWEAAGPLALISLAGLPLLAYGLSLGSVVLRRSWKRLALLAISTVIAASVVAFWWLNSESRGMPPNEHYNHNGWYHVAWGGAYAVGVILLLARPAMAVARGSWRLVRRIFGRPAGVLARRAWGLGRRLLVRTA
jgi:tRNA A-37 threonylcarbamoyl transferase component Bud32